jgi:aryl-alcohol dehydrogenase-like predicted oxidoreductase
VENFQDWLVIHLKRSRYYSIQGILLKIKEVGILSVVGTMHYVNLGKTGLRVSRICLGCMSYGAPASGELKGGRHAWALSEEESQPIFRQALDFGINFFDTANVYSSGASEEVLGRFLKAHTRREAVVVATKVYGVMRDEPNGQGLSRKAILFELDQSLRRLPMDYVDLYQIHRWDYETPIQVGLAPGRRTNFHIDPTFSW